MLDAPSGPTGLIFTGDLDGSENEPDSLSITVALKLMGVGVGLPGDILPDPLTVNHADSQSLLE